MAPTNSDAAKSPRPNRPVGFAIAGLVVILLGSATRAVLVKSGKSEVTSGAAAATPAAVQAAAPTTIESAVTAEPTAANTSAPSVAAVAPVRRRAAVRQNAVSATPSAEQITISSEPTASVAVAPTEPAANTTAAPEPVAAAPAAPDLRQAGGLGAGRPAAAPWDWRAITSIPGVHFAATEITDASSGTAAMAGAHAVRTFSNLEVRLDFDSLFGWSGFSAYAQHKTKTGRNGSGEASFIQSFSNIDASDFRSLGEVYVQQAAFGDRLRLKVGRIDFNTEFAGTSHGASFLNASMGFTPSITAAPTYPTPVNALNVVVSPLSGWHLSGGVFDGTAGAPSAIGEAARFQIAQSAHEWAFGSQALDGKLTLGGWRHTGLFARVSDDSDSDPHTQGTHGWYGTLDQTLWRSAKRGEGDDATSASIGGFLQVGQSDPNVAAVNAHHGGGLTFSGLWSKRASDIFGAAYTNAKWSGGNESISELFYQAPVFSHLSLVADWQHVGRRDVGSPLAVGHVFTLRSIVAF